MPIVLCTYILRGMLDNKCKGHFMFQFLQIYATLRTTPMGLAPMSTAKWLYSNATQVISYRMVMTPSNQYAM